MYSKKSEDTNICTYVMCTPVHIYHWKSCSNYKPLVCTIDQYIHNYVRRIVYFVVQKYLPATNLEILKYVLITL